MATTDHTYHGALTRAGRDYIQAALPKMNEAALSWLTPILGSMADGDPWQEGMAALEIVEAWRKARTPPGDDGGQ